MSTLEGASLNATESVPVEAVAGSELAGATGGQAQDPNITADPYADVSGLPWGQDPRFQQFLADRKAQAERLAAVDTYEQYKDIIDDLRNNGINSAAEFKARIEAEQQQRQAEQERAARLAPVAQSIVARRDAGLIDPDDAEKEFQREQRLDILTHQQQQSNEKLLGYEIRDLIAQEKYKEADPVAVKALVKGGMTPEAAAAHSHAREVQRSQNAIAQYNAGKDKDNALHGNVPQGGAGGGGVNTSAGAMPNPITDPKGFAAWEAAALGAVKR